MMRTLASMRSTDEITLEVASKIHRPYDSASFKNLLKVKQRKITFLLVVTLGYFFVMTLLAGYAREFVTTKLIGSFNVGFGLILLAYIVCWVGALFYVHAANNVFDRNVDAVLKQLPAHRG